MSAKKTPDPIDVHVGSRVRLRRMMAGMSQEKLGESLGVTFQQIQKYEKGTNRIGASRLQSIAMVLDVPVDFFFSGISSSAEEQKKTKTDDAEHLLTFLATQEGLQLNQAFSKIKDARVRRRLVDLIVSLGED